MGATRARQLFKKRVEQVEAGIRQQKTSPSLFNIQYLPKADRFTTITKQAGKGVMQKLNHRLHKCLGIPYPYAVFYHHTGVAPTS